MPGLTLGASFWRGESSFSAPRLDTTVRVGEVDARYQRGRLELRGAVRARRHRRRRPAQRRHPATRSASSPNIAERAARLLRRSRLPRLGPRVAARSRRLRALRELRHAVPDARRASCRSRSSIATRGSPGSRYYPDPDVAVKVDYVAVRNQSGLVRDAALVQRRPGMVVLMQAAVDCTRRRAIVRSSMLASARCAQRVGPRVRSPRRPSAA